MVIKLFIHQHRISLVPAKLSYFYDNCFCLEMLIWEQPSRKNCFLGLGKYLQFNIRNIIKNKMKKENLFCIDYECRAHNYTAVTTGIVSHFYLTLHGFFIKYSTEAMYAVTTLFPRSYMFVHVARSVKTSTCTLFVFSVGATFDLQQSNFSPICLKASKYFGKR